MRRSRVFALYFAIASGRSPSIDTSTTLRLTLCGGGVRAEPHIVDRVVDASGLDWIEPGPTPLNSRRFLTPHPGEAARLLGTVPSVVFGGAVTLATVGLVWRRSRELLSERLPHHQRRDS